MRVLVKVHGLQFIVPCGDGSQSVKWLGLAAAQRYALAAPHGRCRTREDAHIKQGFFLPASVAKAVTNAELSPSQRIADVCKDNDTLIVQLQQEVPVNEIGTPQFASWTVSAFASASSQQQRSKVLADAKASAGDHSELRRADTKSAGSAGAGSVQRKATEDEMKEYARAEMLQQVNSGQFQSEMELEAAFLYDWSRLRVDELERDPKEREAVQELLLAHFATLNNAFMHYAAGSGETAFGMTGDELAHFCHESGLCHYRTERHVVEKIVTQCLRHDALTSLHDRGTLSRVGFLHALLRMVLQQQSGGGRDNNNNNGGGGGASAFRDALEKSLQSNIAPAVTHLTSGPFRDHSHHDRTVAVFQEAKPKLLKLYAKYAAQGQPPATTSTPVSTTWPQLLSAAALKRLLYDAGMFSAGDERRHDDLFANAVEQSFSGVRETKSLDDQLLVFSEFLEVSARVALAVLEENDLPPRDAIKIALDALRSLPLKSAAGATTTTSSRRK